MNIENELYENFHGIVRVKECDEFGDVVMETGYVPEHSREKHALRVARIVAAVNAFEGIPTESIPTAADIGTKKWKWWIQDAARLDNKIGPVHFSDCQCEECTMQVKGN